MRRKQKRLLLRIVLAIVLFIVSAFIDRYTEINKYIMLCLYIVPYAVAGYDVILKAVSNIRYGRIFDENFLMCIATIGAFVISEYPEAVFVMIFYQIGELFQSIAVEKSRKSIASLMDMKPETARVIRGGQELTVDPEDVEPGETVVVRAGEKIPLDGTVLEGNSELNCMALTGESVPQYVEPGMKAISGAVNLSGTLKIEVLSKYEDSTVAKILDLVENASSAKSKTDRFITRFAKYYTPAVVIAALLLFIIPSLITGDYSVWLGRALIFLVISCPCALVISVPLSYFGGLGAASKRGILIKGAVHLEALADVSHVVFDKTGTLTKGQFAVSEVRTADGSPSGPCMLKLLLTASVLEENSNHPVALAVYRYCMEELKVKDYTQIKNLHEYAGLGVLAEYRGERIAAGNLRLMQKLKIEVPEVETTGSVIYVSSNGQMLGYFIVKDKVKASSKETIERLKKYGVKENVMLSGDREKCAKEIAESIGLDSYHAELMPADKVNALETILSRVEDGKKLVYVGDGINDAPVLTRADIGMAMGALGSDAAIEAADVVLMDDDPAKIADSIKIGRATKRIVIENIVFALTVKAVFMILGAFGVANLWEAVFADVGVSVIAILNAMCTLRLK